MRLAVNALPTARKTSNPKSLLFKPLLQEPDIVLLLDETLSNKKQSQILSLNQIWNQSSQGTIPKRERLVLK